MHTYICTGIENDCQFVCHSCGELAVVNLFFYMRDLFPSYCKRHCCYHASENYTDHICSGFWLSGYMPFFSLLEDRKSRSAGNWCFSLSHVSWEVLNIWRSHLSPGTKSCNTTYCLHWSKDSPSGHSFLFFWWTTLCSTITFTLPVGDMAWTANPQLKRIMSSGTVGRMKIKFLLDDGNTWKATHLYCKLTLNTDADKTL